MNQPRTFNAAQSAIVSELCETHVGLEPEQISFEGEDATPIFDFEAVCLLSLKLTDIEKIACEIANRDFDSQIVTARCKVVLPDGKSRVCEDSARMNEIIGDGGRIENLRMADNVAQARAVRRGIRSVGINLYHAHKRFLRDGEAVQGHTGHDPRKPQYEEIHVLAGNLGYINGNDKTEYRELIAASYEGVTSAKDLDDKQLEGFLKLLRGLNRIRRSREQHGEKMAA
jgi:hypothetical protein